VPEDVSFKTKPEIALEQIEAACEAGLARGVVLMDAGYGCNTNLRTSVSALALCYVAGILSQTCVWASGTGPLPPKKWSGRGRRPKLIRRDDKHQPVSVKELALGLPNRAWRTIKCGRGRPNGCPRALLACGFEPRIMTTSSPTAGRRNGS
jgi:SRSO17 transposase